MELTNSSKVNLNAEIPLSVSRRERLPSTM